MKRDREREGVCEREREVHRVHSRRVRPEVVVDLVLVFGIRDSGSGFQVTDFEFRVPVFGFPTWVSDFGFRVPDFGLRVPGVLFFFFCGSRVSGFGLRVSGLGFQVSGFEFQIPASELRASGFGFRGSGSVFRVIP